MDEILRETDPHAEGKTGEKNVLNGLCRREPGRLAQFLAEAKADVGQLRRQGARVFHRLTSAHAGKHLLGPLPFLAVTAVVSVFAVVGTVYMPGYAVSLDGMQMGTVEDRQVFERVLDRVETRVGRILDTPYEIDGEVKYSRALVRRDEMTSVASLETQLFGGIEEITRSYVIKVDGQVMGAGANAEELNAILDEISAPYVNENTTRVEFLSDVEVSMEYISVDTPQDAALVKEVLTANTNGQTFYEVQKGDTFGAIARANGMTMAELQELNPEININRLSVGQIINVKELIPFLSVRTTEHVTYTEPIECPVKEVEDSSMYKGDSKVLDAGIPGEALVVADVIYVNGKEEERRVESSTTLSEPTTKVVAVGTKPRPKTLPTGTLKWPLSGKITSKFGYRTIFGSYSYHSGIDIAAPYGTAIKAADGGTVTFSGYKGTYGYLVIIDHGGTKTYYGHCSKLLVSAGTKVYQGQTIARVGSTGRSTGNHCHFEVRIGNKSVNPLAYLP